MEIRNKVIIVTGAASGIGLALAHRFKRDRAACIAMCDIDEAGIRAAAEEVGGIPYVSDVSVSEQVADVVADVEERFGRVDVYCANAGVLMVGGVEVSDALWGRVLDVNLMAHVYAARTCLPGMIRRGGGYFLNTVSAAGLLSQIGSVTYSVSKHAAIGFAEWLVINHGHQGIRVTALCPQAVDTPMIDGKKDGGVAGLDGVLSPDEIADCAAAAIREETFLALPHPRVRDYFRNKAGDYDRWIAAMQRLREKFPEG